MNVDRFRCLFIVIFWGCVYNLVNEYSIKNSRVYCGVIFLEIEVILVV